jgi:hypothetical protein
MPAPEPIPDLLKAVNEASGKTFALRFALSASCDIEG